MPDRNRPVAGSSASGPSTEDEARARLLAVVLGWTPMPAVCSQRWRRSAADGFLVTPPATADRREPSLDDIGWFALGDVGARRATTHPEGAQRWRLYQALYRQGPSRRAIVCSRPVYCATLACLAQSSQAGIPAPEGIPAFHPDVEQAGGGPIVCVALPSDDSSSFEPVLTALADRPACLLAGYGLLVTGTSLEEARWRTVEIENLAGIYWRLILARQGR